MTTTELRHCDGCRKQIDVIERITLYFHGKRIPPMDFCDKKCLFNWANKGEEV